MAKKKYKVGGGASRTTDPAAGTSAATDVSLREHLAQRLHETEKRLDDRFHDLREADWRFAEERDRRYAEVAIEKEKALRIKETADLAALGLAREIQTYKDEKANELREQINSERGLYATKGDLDAFSQKVEAQLAPLAEYVATQRGSERGVDRSRDNRQVSMGYVFGVIGALATIISIILVVGDVLTS